MTAFKRLDPLPADRTDRNRVVMGLAASALAQGDAPDPLPTHPGGRAEALRRLAAVRPGAYGRTRNFLDGAVTRLSPYIRHGLLSLAEVRDHVLAVASAAEAQKLVQELAWRDYWQRLLDQWGMGVRDNREGWKTGWADVDYAPKMPTDIATGTTGLACIDGFVATLRTQGWLHNHARMYLASYVIHFRRIHWRPGAEWMMGLLIDGDFGSNHLSWQWVASTFGAKPYIFNRDNLATYTRGQFCARCLLAEAGCPMEASYPALTARLFPHGAAP